MKTPALLPALLLLLAGVCRVVAQSEPTPLATPADIPAPSAQAAASASPAPTAPPAAACPMCGMAAADCKDEKAAKPPESDDAVLKQLEQDWGDAIVKTDLPALERIVGEEYTSVGPDGAVSNKADHLAAAKTVTGKIESFSFSGVQVRVYGTTAVVTGDGTIHWSPPSLTEGVPGSAPFRWMDVFVKRDGRWQAVASQTTDIGKAPAAE